MINKSRGNDLQPFAGLTPEVVLDAAAASGLEPDGRLFALNSYENRVYQLGAGARTLVLKFYRPPRWGDARSGAVGGRPAHDRRGDAAAFWRVSLCRLPLPARARPRARCARGAPAPRQEPRQGAPGRREALVSRSPADRCRAPRVAGAPAGARQRAVAAGAAPELRLGERGAARAGERRIRRGRRRARDPPSRRLPPRESAVGRARPGVRRPR